MNAHCPALSCGLNSSSVATFCSHKDHGSCIRQIIFSFAINQLMEITPTSPSSFCTGKVISSMGVQKYALTDEEDTRQCHSRRWDEKGEYICLELVLLYSSLFTGLQTEVIHWARRYFKKLMHFHGLWDLIGPAMNESRLCQLKEDTLRVPQEGKCPSENTLSPPYQTL